MITITDEYITGGKLDKEALARLSGHTVRIEGDKIFFYNDITFDCCYSLKSLRDVFFKRSESGHNNIKFFYCDSLDSLDGATFNSNVQFLHCKSLASVAGATFNLNVEFSHCDSLTSVSGATFKKGFKAVVCPNLKQ